ncbi:uncharacterized protein MYCFIDRAFT_210832 [Pseudocercospora fijiensis CIRAD86]|uniref:RlpA-like protein double-psi beta-barrel domain-containing protein n=1 Tax=Pseudocercospora fijiensis (strain CIRAD86) TaxID=383855 RepID=M3AI57_PSEFD|nr:uncharacterized protein MYCFIDRAFT_210832 [Pseudocercospora fijiensis CIRAD86]EME84256.1 hypothetical protein MYCFIDRAFT_210832 [Pseudocercospora fijiensis CIRAD86]
MFTNSIIAATGALLTLVAAVPMADQHPHHRHHPAHKRDYVWVTLTEVDIETVAVTKTVWIEPGETPPPNVKAPQPYGAPASSSSSSSPAPAAYTPPASSSPSSSPAPAAYTPPAFSSSSSHPPAYIPPAPSTPQSTYVAPAYTPPATSTPPTYTAPTPSSAPAAPASGVSSSGNGLSGLGASGTYYSGDLTWYDVGLGACGETSTSNEAIVAIPEKIFDAYTVGGNPNKNPLCGKYVTITGKDGSLYKAKIVDRCPGCTQNDLDLSQDFFNKVTQNGDGRVHGMKWCFD